MTAPPSTAPEAPALTPAHSFTPTQPAARLLGTNTRLLARLSLILLWLGTAAASLLSWNGRSTALLVQAELPAAWHAWLITGGAALDAALGLALWRWHTPTVYRWAGVGLALMSGLASALLPTLWLDPLGSLSKNLPVAALLLVLHEDARKDTRT